MPKLTRWTLAIAAFLVSACAHTSGDPRHFAYPRSWKIVRASAVTGDTPNPQEQRLEPAPDDPITIPQCGNPNAFTAVNREPPVRVVVYDPVSNSFAYADPCAEQRDAYDSPHELRDAELRDRYHLVLTSQKIRLLLMPYDSRSGDLLLEVKPGTGAEFDLVPKGTVTTAAEQKPAQQKKQDVPSPPGVDRTKAAAQTKAENVARTKESTVKAAVESNQAMGLSDMKWSEATNPAGSLLITLEALIKDYNDRTARVRELFHAVQPKNDCLDQFRERIRVAIDRRFAGQDEQDKQEPKFTLASDLPLEDIKKEAERRARIVQEEQIKDPNCGIEKATSFDESIRNLSDSLAGTQSLVDNNASALDEIEDVINKLATEKNAPKINGNQYDAKLWKEQLENYRNALKRLRDHQSAVEKIRDDTVSSLAATVKNFRAALTDINSAASQVQRFDYPPLREGESVTFVIRRSDVDDKTTRLPGKANMIELRSTPADLFRFGMGLTRTAIKDPTFKAGPETPADSNGNKQRQLLYDDAGNGGVVAAAFVHHNWGRRSPFLTPTWIERAAPTFSLGLPLNENKALFDQLLVGLNWELTPGFDFVAGQHFKKVNALIKGHHVGEFNDTTVDTSMLQQKKFQNAWYFGVALNTDLFTTLGSNRTPAK